MAVSGFEGFEKRLELHFYGDDPVLNVYGHGDGVMGLRLLDFDSLEKVLDAVQCTVVAAVANRYFDAYVLSESSLFVYPTKIIIKTCGTTQLLNSIRPLILYARNLGLELCGCRYTRGNFIFPASQPFPHTSFEDEVVSIEENLPNKLCYRKASVMPSKLHSHSWHVFTASDGKAGRFSSVCSNNDKQSAIDGSYTVEVCMTKLDRGLARKFFKQEGNGDGTGIGTGTGTDMTQATGIDGIIPEAIICDFVFDPCGYSMNGVDGDRYSTIHVTPEDGFSYASFECVGSIYDQENEIANVLRKAVQVFRPAIVSVSTTSTSNEVWTHVAPALEPLGLKCRSRVTDEFPDVGTVVFQTFTSRRKFNQSENI